MAVSEHSRTWLALRMPEYCMRTAYLYLHFLQVPVVSVMQAICPLAH